MTLDKDHPVLTIVTESQGHINFGSSMAGDIKVRQSITLVVCVLKQFE